MEKELKDFILNSYNLLQNNEQRGRYFHKLNKDDNSPTVVHNKTNQLTYVIDGRGKVFINGVEKEIYKDMVLCIYCGDTHRFIAYDEGLILFHIHIPDSGRDLDREIIEGNDYDRYK